MMERLRKYVWVDYHSRWRNDLWCVAVSLSLYVFAKIIGTDEDVATDISVGLLLVTVTATTVWYCVNPLPKREAKAVDLSKRTLPRLIWQLAAALVLAVLGKFTTPTLEGQIVDARLRWAGSGELSRDKIVEAAEIVRVAKDNDIRISPLVITQVGQKILSSAAQPHLQRTAVEAASQFASYRSSLQALPLRVNTMTTLNATPTEPKGPPISLTIGCAEGRTGGKARLQGIFGFGGFDVGNCQDVVVWPAKPIVLHLDNVDGKNATFVNCTLTYNGGKLTLENVRFVNCIFQMSDTYARNHNVLQLLTAALTGQPIHLALANADA
jgi:hypothetical protein